MITMKPCRAYETKIACQLCNKYYPASSLQRHQRVAHRGHFQGRKPAAEPGLAMSRASRAGGLARLEPTEACRPYFPPFTALQAVWCATIQFCSGKTRFYVFTAFCAVLYATDHFHICSAQILYNDER